MEEFLVQSFFCQSLCEPFSISHNLHCIGQLVNYEHNCSTSPCHGKRILLWYFADADIFKMPLSLPPHCPSDTQFPISWARTKHVFILQSTFEVHFPQNSLHYFQHWDKTRCFPPFRAIKRQRNLEGDPIPLYLIRKQSSHAGICGSWDSMGKEAQFWT